jgi:transposase-like protein
METIATDLTTQGLGANVASPRKVFTPQQRREMVARYRRSGLKQEQFVAQVGISKAALGKWLQQERREGRPTPPPVSFQELKLPGSAKWAVEIVSPANWTVRLAQLPPPGLWNQLWRALPC